MACRNRILPLSPRLSAGWVELGFPALLVVVLALLLAPAVVGARTPKNKRSRDPAAVAASNARIVAGIHPVGGEVRWRFIVLHHTATVKSSLRGIDRYHRRRFQDPLGIEYHFLIGNGHSAPDGAIEFGRWRSRARSLHVVHPERVPAALTISLMGNLHERPPSAAQMHAVELLMRRLMLIYRIDVQHLSTNTRVDGTFTVCPGRHFPLDNLLWRLRTQSKSSLAAWRRPWPAVPMLGPLKDTAAVAKLLVPRFKCRRAKLIAPAMTEKADLKGLPEEPWVDARVFRRVSADGCATVKRQLVGLRTAKGWYVQELNGYRTARLRRKGRGARARVQVIDGRGVMLTCGRPRQVSTATTGTPAMSDIAPQLVCETTTSGRKPRRHNRRRRARATKRRKGAK